MIGYYYKRIIIFSQLILLAFKLGNIIPSIEWVYVWLPSIVIGVLQMIYLLGTKFFNTFFWTDYKDW